MVLKRGETNSVDRPSLAVRLGNFSAPELCLRMVLRHSNRSSEQGPPIKARLCNQARQLISSFPFVEFEVSDLSKRDETTIDQDY
jgi:hypothetical protein